MTLEIGALQKARHPPAGLVQLSERMCKLSVRVIPQKISLASSVMPCEVYFIMVCIIWMNYKVTYYEILCSLCWLQILFFCYFAEAHLKNKSKHNYDTYLVTFSFNLLQFIWTVLHLKHLIIVLACESIIARLLHCTALEHGANSILFNELTFLFEKNNSKKKKTACIPTETKVTNHIWQRVNVTVKAFSKQVHTD